MYRISESLLSQLSSRVAARFRGAAGDRTRVGLFIRVPEHLAEMFPPAPPEDTSPRHVTLLYVGEVPAEHEGLFLEVVRGVLEGWGPVDAAFDGLDYFIHPEKDRRVYYTRVKFDRDMGALRDRLSHMLGEFGFTIEDAHPLAYNAHATLDYVDGLFSEYTGPVPSGDWQVTEIEVWGLPSEHAIFLGDRAVVNTRLAAPSPSSDVWAEWMDHLPGGLADKKTPKDFDQKQLEKGQKIEMEHVDDPDLAQEIAMDHLVEEADYYKLLEKVEKHSHSGPDPESVDRGLSRELSAGLDPDMAWDIVHDNLAADPTYYNG